MRNIRLQISILFLGVCTGCFPLPFRYIEGIGASKDAADARNRWDEYARKHSRVELLEQSSRPPIKSDQVQIYYVRIPQSRQKNFYPFRLSDKGAYDRVYPGPDHQGMAKITICKPVSVGHEDALKELKERAAELGANVVYNVGYVLIVESYYHGGSRVSGRKYYGTAGYLDKIKPEALTENLGE